MDHTSLDWTEKRQQHLEEQAERAGLWTLRVDDRVVLSVLHVDKRLDFGEDRGPDGQHAHLCIQNGARGRIQLRMLNGTCLIEFDALGPGVFVTVPLAWLVKE